MAKKDEDMSKDGADGAADAAPGKKKKKKDGWDAATDASKGASGASDAEDDEDEDEDEDCGKSMDAVRRAIAKSGEAILKHLQSNDGSVRMEALLAKAAQSPSKLGEDDRAELIARLQGRNDQEALAARVTKGMASEPLEKSLNDSPFLTEFAKGQVAAHKAMAEHLEKSCEAFTDSALLLLKHQQLLTKGLNSVMEQQAELRKSQDKILARPAGAPRSVGIAAEDRPSVDTNNPDAPAGDKMDELEIRKGLRGLMHKAGASGDQAGRNQFMRELMNYDGSNGRHYPSDKTCAKIKQHLADNA